MEHWFYKSMLHTISMRKFNIESRSQKNIYYEVSYFDDGKINCNCPSGSRNKACNHIELLLNFIKRNPVDAIEYDRIKEIK